MAVPKRRMSKSQSRKRRSHQAVQPVGLTRCRQCHQAIPPHVVCPNCGQYRGREMLPAED